MCTRLQNPISLSTLVLKDKISSSPSSQLWMDVITANASTLQTFGFYVEVNKHFPFTDIAKTALRYCPKLDKLVLYWNHMWKRLPLHVLDSEESPLTSDLVAELGESLRHFAPKLKTITIEYYSDDIDSFPIPDRLTLADVQILRLQINELGRKAEALERIVRDNGFERLTVDFTSSFEKIHRLLMGIV